MRRTKQAPPPERQQWFWVQFEAFDLIRKELFPKRAFKSGLMAYRKLIALAADAGCGPSPDTPGIPFKITVRLLAMESNQQPALAFARLRDFERIGLIEVPAWPADFVTPFAVRICTILEEEDQL